MLSFELTEDHRLLEQSVREWAAREVAPRIHDLDRTHHFDPDILPQMASVGLLGISVPIQYGGAGMDYVALGLASEELEYVDTSLRVILSVHAGLNCLTLLSWGTEDQKQRYLIPQAQGRKIATYALTEPSAGSDARGIQSVAIKKGERYLLTGEKTWISLADVADNYLVFAWTDLEKKQQRDASGMSAFIVERTFKGVSSGTLTEKWGILAGNTGFFKMEEVEVPRENLVGREGEGFKIAMFALDQGRYTRGGRRCGPDSGVPRCERDVCQGAQDVWRRDRGTPARQGNDRADGVRLSGVTATLAARGLAQERRPTEHEGNRPRQVVCHGRVGKGGQRRRGDSRRQRVFGRVSCRSLLSQLQGGRDLRGHSRNSQDHAGRLPAGIPHRSTAAL